MATDSSTQTDTLLSEMDEDDDFVIITHQEVNAARRPRFLNDISDYIDSIAEELWPINKKIHDKPELGYGEVIAHYTLTAYMKTQPGWTVTRSAYGMKTAWVAVYDTGKRGPCVSFNVEMDALPAIGHACGHNLIATASLAGALATVHLLSLYSLPGRVVLFGTPAEEGGGGKIRLLAAGAYKDHGVDISLISHPGTIPDCALTHTTAYIRMKVEYFGREAHAAAEPWLGVNALDALITAYNGISVLRQQTMPSDIIQGHITDGGAGPNIIHAYAAGIFVVRAATQRRLEALVEKVMGCFDAGALATGAKVKVTRLMAYKDHVPNRLLARSYARYFNPLVPEEGDGGRDGDGNEAGGPSKIPEDQDVDEMRGRSGASSDQGDIAHAMPSIMPGFEIPPGPGGAGPHNPGFAESAGTRLAFERSLRVAKALAGTAIDVLNIDGLLEEVKKEWRRSMTGSR
ncbi:hypothetical protein GE21DRAFT_8597 [Neurospora crassa]|uniref:Peptidase M20 domain-containing protein 2 n=1 Tax=Neurospora crassa (strain ATCC 24698 / 74-OR23-1A / CBS 708.71 / DSM 1257 / FGSC 987) TaxID=367110 RepID=Q7S675_NEUCR|nr:hypothetical protein NCU07100 [Neurospora crassa OR74A]EAA31025.2 hypothetical protein NCU07100 [Neurospora crassa OR74A]KHE86826.1 hypothetical protein GE21DRAFT_8597 [Neurospora crassa]|eukprot:XP_960261.2 hypothetical protein NCU07100 [Neurospora crassa OR74A]